MIDGANASKFFQLVKSLPGFTARSGTAPVAAALKRRKSTEKKRRSHEKKRPTEAANDDDVELVETDAPRSSLSAMAPAFKVEDLRFSSSKNVVDRQCHIKLNSGTVMQTVKTVTITWDHYPEVAYYHHKGAEKKKGMYILQPIMRASRSVNLILYNCSRDLLDEMLKGEDASALDINLVRIDTTCTIDDKECFKFIQKIGKVVNRKLFNVIVAPSLHNFADFVNLSKTDKSASSSSKASNPSPIVQSYGLVLKLVDNPSCGSIIHKEMFRKDTELVVALHVDVRPTVSGKMNPKCPESHYPGACSKAYKNSFIGVRYDLVAYGDFRHEFEGLLHLH